MPQFTYIGKDGVGTTVKETVTADDRFAVYELARESGHTVDSISEKQRFSMESMLDMEKINAFLSRVKQDELVMVTRNLGSMLNAGLPLSRALSVITRQTKNPKLKQVVTDVTETIKKGEPFYQALSRHPKVFDDLYVAMVSAGEESGSLAVTLQTLSKQMHQSATLKKQIKGAMIYPAIVITILVIIGILMMIYVMPSITDTFKSLEVELPATTAAMMAASDFMVAHTLVVIGGLIAGVMGFIYFLRTTIGRKVTSWIFPKLPVIGTMVKETNSARTSRTLSSLLSAGVDVLRALEITADVVQNYYYKEIIMRARKQVEAGSPLSEQFIAAEKLYPVLVGEMIQVGEETGDIAQMMEQLATFYEAEVERKTKDLSTIIEPLLMVVIGGTVGFFALAMIAPIYSISDSI